MSQNLEIEFKNLLTKEEYELLVEYFQLKKEDFFQQENHYFDTEDFALKQQNSALRIRKKQSHFELTLKQPFQEGLLETNKTLTTSESEAIFKTGQILDTQIAKLLSDMNIDPQKIHYFGSLTTIRAEKEIGSNLLVFDHSFYLNTEDYELEYEVTNKKEGEEYFYALLHNLNIPLRETKNKVRRFYEEKYNQQSNNNSF